MGGRKGWFSSWLIESLLAPFLTRSSILSLPRPIAHQFHESGEGEGFGMDRMVDRVGKDNYVGGVLKMVVHISLLIYVIPPANFSLLLLFTHVGRPLPGVEGWR
jgi:hypothetical protein